MCHGDISLNNIVINRIWDDNNDDDEIDNNDDDNIDIKSISNNNNSSSDNMALNIAINKNNASEIVGPGKVHTTDISNNSQPISLIDSPAALSSSGPRPVPIKAHGLVIDNNNLFSLSEVDKLGYQVHSVRRSLHSYPYCI